MDVNLPLDKNLNIKLPEIRSVFQDHGKYYPQFF